MSSIDLTITALLVACSQPAPIAQAPVVVVVQPATSECHGMERVLVDDALASFAIDAGVEQ